MKTLEEIKKTLIANKKELSQKYPIYSLAIFGSYAREEATSQSDLDLLVEFSDKIGMRFIDLAGELENITQLKVDLVSKRGIKKPYYEVIEQDLIYV